MAITDIKEYAHLTPEDVDSLARELDAIRTDIEESRGERDANLSQFLPTGVERSPQDQNARGQSATTTWVKT